MGADAPGSQHSGIARLRKADDSAYDELRKILAAIGIDIKTLR